MLRYILLSILCALISSALPAAVYVPPEAVSPDIPPEALTAQAKEALSFGIPYPCKLEGAAEITELHDEEIIPVSELVPVMKDFLKRRGFKVR